MKPTDDKAFETWFASKMPRPAARQHWTAYDTLRDWSRKGWRECRERMEDSGQLTVDSGQRARVAALLRNAHRQAAIASQSDAAAPITNHESPVTSHHA